MDKFLIKKVRKEDVNCVLVKDKFDINLIAYPGVRKLECDEDLKGRYKCEKEEKGKKNTSSDPDSLPAKRAFLDNGSLEYNLEVWRHEWKSVSAEDLNVKYTQIFSKKTADYIFKKLEEDVKYFSGDLLKVKVYGKWHNIPRKQVSFGDPGLSYAFSGTTVPAVPWSRCKIILELKKLVESVSGHSFNFVLVNRYKDGMDHIGEHRDDEKDLVATAPIASLSLGQARDFIFKHKDARGSKRVREIDPVMIELEHGSLLLMEWPTNKFWYHSLPVRKKAVNVRINLTFRQMVKKK